LVDRLHIHYADKATSELVLPVGGCVLTVAADTQPDRVAVCAGGGRHRVSKDGTAFAVRGPAVLRHLDKIGNCQIGVSVHLVNERASCAADWRLFCPESWDERL
jgi:hypothetical protein